LYFNPIVNDLIYSKVARHLGGRFVCL